MEIEEGKDIVLTQGKEYKPQGESYVQEENPEDISKTDNVEHVGGGGFIGFVKENPLILAGVAVVLLVVIVTIVIVASVKTKKNSTAADMARMEELLAEDEEDVPAFTYTEEEVEKLRQAGYTGTEIEENQANEVDVKYLLDASAAARKQLYEEEVLPYFNSASAEFKKLAADTWVGNPEFELGEKDLGLARTEEVVNVDYEKLPPKGHQLFVKFYLQYDSVACFMVVTPERYYELEPAGNIVLSITYTTTEDGNKVITDIIEVIP